MWAKVADGTKSTVPTVESLKEKPGQFHGDRLRIPPTSGATLIKEKHLVPQESRVRVVPSSENKDSGYIWPSNKPDFIQVLCPGEAITITINSYADTVQIYTKDMLIICTY